MIIDTHCHLYLEEFNNDRSEVIKQAQNIGVQKFYLPNIDSTSIQAMLQMEKEYPNICFPMMGLHPCSVKENVENELSLIHEWLQKRNFCAIGEIGLDFYWDVTFKQQQLEAFKQQMQWALQYNMPVVIHTRNAMQEAIDCVKPFAQQGLRGIFHCFSGNLNEANQIIDMNFLLGIGGVITFKNAGLDVVLKSIDLKNIVVETDAPYLAPVPFRGKRNESSYLKYIVEKIALIKEIAVQEVENITTQNAANIFLIQS